MTNPGTLKYPYDSYKEFTILAILKNLLQNRDTVLSTNSLYEAGVNFSRSKLAQRCEGNGYYKQAKALNHNSRTV